MTRSALLAWASCCLASAGGFGCSSSDADTIPAASGSAGNSGAGSSAGSAGSETSGAAGQAGSVGSGGSAGALAYAHVVAVSTSGADQAYTFSVSIESADIDCTQFANWWEVLAEDGSLLYRRILEHSHTDENGTTDADKPGNTFTRPGGPVAVSGDALVIVRAHLSTGGYNGHALRGSASAGFADAPEIRADFAPEVESQAPQPTGCDF